METLLFLRKNTTGAGVFRKNDIDSCFYHNIFDTFQSQHRIVRVSKSSDNEPFTFKLFYFCDSMTQQLYIFREEVNTSKRELSSWINSLCDFVKTFDKESKCLQIPLTKPKTEIGSTKSENNLFAQ